MKLLLFLFLFCGYLTANAYNEPVKITKEELLSLNDEGIKNLIQKYHQKNRYHKGQIHECVEISFKVSVYILPDSTEHYQSNHESSFSEETRNIIAELPPGSLIYIEYIKCRYPDNVKRFLSPAKFEIIE